MSTDQTAEAVWEGLRSTRWKPPAPTLRSPERRTTYVFALEQAEQMFRAASTVGPATQPLLVFYGLSQAGRAVAAAVSNAEGDRWELRGHGIRSDALQGPLPDVAVRTDPSGSKGSFARLSELLDSPLWERASIRLNDLWDALPENRESPLVETGNTRRTPLHVAYRAINSEPHPLVSVPVDYFPPWITSATNPHEAFLEYLEAFPEAGGYDSFEQVSPYDSQPLLSLDTKGWGEVRMNWRVPEEIAGEGYLHRVQYLKTIARPYNDAAYFFPALGENRSSTHPLMTWWAVLHALSMLARYQPAEWATHINIDTSPYAAPIERLLKTAIRVVPEVISETIEQVAR